MYNVVYLHHVPCTCVLDDGFQKFRNLKKNGWKTIGSLDDQFGTPTIHLKTGRVHFLPIKLSFRLLI